MKAHGRRAESRPEKRDTDRQPDVIDAADEIRAQHAAGITIAKLAKMYAVNRQTIRRVIRGG